MHCWPWWWNGFCKAYFLASLKDLVAKFVVSDFEVNLMVALQSTPFCRFWMELLKLEKLVLRFWLKTTTPSKSLVTETMALTPWVGNLDETVMVKSCVAPSTEKTVDPGSGLMEKAMASSFVLTVGFSGVDSLLHPTIQLVMTTSKLPIKKFSIFFMS